MPRLRIRTSSRRRSTCNCHRRIGTLSHQSRADRRIKLEIGKRRPNCLHALRAIPCRGYLKQSSTARFSGNALRAIPCRGYLASRAIARSFISAQSAGICPIAQNWSTGFNNQCTFKPRAPYLPKNAASAGRQGRNVAGSTRTCAAAGTSCHLTV